VLSVCAALTLVANANAAPNVVNVKTNARGGVLTGDELRVEVRPRKAVQSFQAWLDITDVTDQFASRARGMRTARLSTGDLSAGVHHLYVQTSGGNGKGDFDTVRFVAGRPSENLLSTGRPRLGSDEGAVVVGVELAQHDGKLRAWLNGHRVSEAFSQIGAANREARLGANDGVRFGVNSLRVIVFHDDGFYDVDTIRFDVPRTHPLAGAGRDRLGTVRGRIQLDGTASRATTRGASLRFTWRIVAKPRGSKARLRDSHGTRPSLYPDVNGRYRVQLTVSQGRVVGRDMVTADATPPDPPLGVRIDTLDENGRVVIDGKPVPNTGGGPNRVSLVVLSRYDRSVKKSASYAGTRAGIADLKTAMTPGDQGYQNLVVVSGRGVQSDAAADLVSALAAIGAAFETIDQVKIGAGTPFSVIGVPGSSAGSAFTKIGRVESQPGNLSGYLQVNLSNPSTTQYGFVYADFVPFSTHLNVSVEAGYANAVTVGGNQYQSGAVFVYGGQSGFQVVVLDGGTLALKANRTFITTTAFAAHDEENQRAMASFLSQVAAGDVVFVQSIPPGLPLSAGPFEVWDDIARQVESLGGNRAVFNALYPVYGLAGTRRPVRPGTAAGVEIYSADNDDDASATGYFVRNHSGLFEPESADLTAGLPNAELVRYAYQPAQQWPDSTTAGQKAANDWITRQLKLLGRCGDPSVLCDMRAQYYLNFNAAWGSIFAQLQALKFPKGEKSFSQADFNVMKRDFVQELPLVDRVSKYINSLQEPLNRAEGRGHVDLAQIAQAIQAELGTPAGSSTLSNTLTLLGYVAALGKVDPELAPFATAVSGVLALGGYLTRPNGGGTWASIDAKVAELSDELSARFDTFHGQIVQLGRILVSDPGKLGAVADRVYTDGWRLDGSYQRMLDTLTKTSRAWLMGALLPVPWGLWRLETYGVVLGNARSWYCEFPEGGDFYDTYVFSNAADSGQESHTIKFPQGKPYPQVSVVAPRNIDWRHVDSQTPVPPASLTDPLFLPVDSPNPKALGLQKWYFYSPLVFPTNTATTYQDDCRSDTPPPPPRG
jgi:hypothetical protein